MEKKDKREFTDEEVLAIVRHCNDHSVSCKGCPAHNECGTCDDHESSAEFRLIEMYEEKCKELEEWKKSHAICIEDITERGEREAHLEIILRSYQDQYIKSREECDKLHAYNTELHEQLDRTLELADKLEEENLKINLELSMERLKVAASKTSVSAKEATESTLVLGYAMKVSALEEENKKLKEENEVLRDDLYRVGEERAKFKEENEELLTANKHLIQVRDEYREAMPILTEANNKFRSENEKLKKDNDALTELYYKVFLRPIFKAMEERYGK